MSFFPLVIQLIDTEEQRIIDCTDDFPIGIGFKILVTDNLKEKYNEDLDAYRKRILVQLSDTLGLYPDIYFSVFPERPDEETLKNCAIRDAYYSSQGYASYFDRDNLILDDPDPVIRLKAYTALGFSRRAMSDSCKKIRRLAYIKYGFPEEYLSKEKDGELLKLYALYNELKTIKSTLELYS